MWIIYNTKTGEFYDGWVNGSSQPLFFNFNTAFKFKKKKFGQDIMNRLESEKIEGEFLLLRIESEVDNSRK